MFDFTSANPVRIHFGKESLKKLPEEILKHGKKVLLVFGGSSLKNYGHYDKIVSILSANGIAWVDFGGNVYPSYAKVLEAIEVVKKEQIDVILGIGGSTCMDMAKIIAFGAKNDNLWDYLSEELSPMGKEMLAVGEIPTFPSGGSEADAAAEIDDLENGKHGALYGRYPDFAILFPEFTYSVNPRETAYGALVMFAQASSSYFGGDSPISEALCEALLKQILIHLETALKTPGDYNARANLMWASALTTSGVLSRGKLGAWSMYASESIAENLLHVPYRVALAVMFPKWLKAVSGHFEEATLRYVRNVLDIDPKGKTDSQAIDEGVRKLQDIFNRFGIPSTYRTLAEYNLEDLKLPMLELEEDDILNRAEIIEMFSACL